MSEFEEQVAEDRLCVDDLEQDEVDKVSKSSWNLFKSITIEYISNELFLFVVSPCINSGY